MHFLALIQNPVKAPHNKQPITVKKENSRTNVRLMVLWEDWDRKIMHGL